MGFVAPDETKDFVKISGTQIQPKSGKYSIQITEELWETAYFDEVKLIAVDHPVDTDIFVNEQYTPPPFAEFKIYGVAEKRFPKSAVDHHGEDVSDALKAFDYHYAVEHAPGAYQGVVEPHAIVLDLGNVPNDTPLTLFLRRVDLPDGYEYQCCPVPESTNQSTFPVSCCKRQDWRMADRHRYDWDPGWKNKTVTVDLTGKFLSDDRRVRIQTDMQIYWDAAFFTVGTQAVPMEVTTVNPDSADLHYRGFSEMYRPNPHAPHLFDYKRLQRQHSGETWRDITPVTEMSLRYCRRLTTCTLSSMQGTRSQWNLKPHACRH